MDKMREMFTYAVAALAIFAFLAAVYQAFNGQKGATSLGILFIVGSLIVFLPDIEFFKVFGVETKLREKVNEATVILEKLKTLSTIAARSTYQQMAWSNRLGAPLTKDKQAILDDVDQQLAGMGISSEERKTIAKTYVRMIGVDFYQLYTQVLDRYLTWKRNELGRQLQTQKDNSAKQAIEEFSANSAGWRTTAFRGNAFVSLETHTLAEELNKVSPEKWVRKDEMAKAEEFKLRLVRLFASCEAKGGYTSEAAEFYDKYRDLAGYDLLIKEYFGVNPSEVR